MNFGMELSESFFQEMGKMMARGELIKEYFEDNTNPLSLINKFKVRDILTKGFSWPIITKEWLDDMAILLSGLRVHEICAGTGMICKLMKERGIKWTASDETPRGTNVLKMDALKAISKFADTDVFFASWIPYQSELDQDLLKTDKPLIILGEFWGCTGSDKFWSEVDKRDLFYGNVSELLKHSFHDVPNWDGIHDFTSFFRFEKVAKYIYTSRGLAK